jgi:hypothetical protein
MEQLLVIVKGVRKLLAALAGIVKQVCAEGAHFERD